MLDAGSVCYTVVEVLARPMQIMRQKIHRAGFSGRCIERMGWSIYLKVCLTFGIGAGSLDMISSEGRRKAGSLKKTWIVWDRAISVNRREKAH